MHRRVAFLPVGLCAAVLTSYASAQVPSALLRQGDSVPVGSVTQPVVSFGGTDVNAVGGYAVVITTEGPFPPAVSHVWGSATGGAGAVLRSESIVAGFEQVAFDPVLGLDDAGKVAYSGTSDLTNGTVNGLFTAWHDTVLLASEGDPIPSLPGKVYGQSQKVGLTGSGLAYWVADIRDQATGAHEGRGLVIAPGTVLHKSGDAFPGVPGSISTSVPSLEPRFSSQANHYLFQAWIGGETMLLDGLPLSTAGSLIRVGHVIRPGAGGLPFEKWASFHDFAVNESGSYAIQGDTTGGVSNDNFLLFDGKIIYREGDVVGDANLTEAKGIAMNDSGDIAHLWNGAAAGGSLPEALLLNNKLLAREGDPVDLDGDGVVEPTSILSTFGNTVSVGADRKVYFVAKVDVNGTAGLSDDVQALFVVEDPCPTSVQRFGVGCAGSNGQTPSIDLGGCFESGGSVTLTMLGGPPLGPAAVMFGTTPADVALGPPGCALNLGGVFGAPLLLTLDASGGLLLDVPIAAVPAGTTFTMQAFVGDAGAPLGFVGTNGLRVVSG